MVSWRPRHNVKQRNSASTHLVRFGAVSRAPAGDSRIIAKVRLTGGGCRPPDIPRLAPPVWVASLGGDLPLDPTGASGTPEAPVGG
eukprot:15212198-Alexandrium_andersonii.AAC.1